MLVSASMDWALEMRGTPSKVSAMTALGQVLHHLVVGGRRGVDEGNQVLAGAHHVHLVDGQFLIKQRLLDL